MDTGEIQREAHNCAQAKGWWDEPEDTIPAKLLMVHSEVSEAVEELRSGMYPLDQTYHTGIDEKPEGFGIELADAILRIADIAERAGIDLNECLREKMAYNWTRPHRHGGKVI